MARRVNWSEFDTRRSPAYWLGNVRAAADDAAALTLPLLLAEVDPPPAAAAFDLAGVGFGEAGAVAAGSTARAFFGGMANKGRTTSLFGEGRSSAL